MSFKNYVKNKKVVAVGPAPSAFENTKEFIESYDIIMRFNSAVPVSIEASVHIGNRTDILCNCLEEDPISGGKLQPDVWKQHGVKWLLSPYPENAWFCLPNVNRFKNINKGILPIEFFDFNDYQILENKLGTRPNSGLLGIIHLLKFGIKELYITGFTFGRGGYQKGYKDHISEEEYNKLANGKWHSQKPQEEYFKKIIYPNPIVKVDNTLKGILE